MPASLSLAHHGELLGDARPRVVDQILVGLAAGGEHLEVLDALAAASRASTPAAHCGSVGRLPRTSTVDGVRWKTKSCCADRRQVRHALDGGGAGADDPDPLVGQVAPGRRRCSRSPTGWCGTSWPPNVVDTRRCPAVSASAGIRWPSTRTGPASASPRLVVMIQREVAGVPTDLAYLGLQAGVAVQVVVLGDAPAVRQDLRALGVLLGGDVAELLEQRHVHVGLDVTRDARVAVPVPGAAHVGRLVDQPHARRRRAGAAARPSAVRRIRHRRSPRRRRRSAAAGRNARPPTGLRRMPANRPAISTYCAIPSGRSRRSRSSAYFRRSASTSNVWTPIPPGRR